MHNSHEDNLRFKIAFTETNLRWLLGETPRNEPLINKTKNDIATMHTNLETVARNVLRIPQATTHTEHAKKQKLSKPCTCHDLNFGGECFNCGYVPPKTTK